MASYCLKEGCVVIGCSRVGVFVRHLESDTDVYKNLFAGQLFYGLSCVKGNWSRVAYFALCTQPYPSIVGRPKAINAEIQFVGTYV